VASERREDGPRECRTRNGNAPYALVFYVPRDEANVTYKAYIDNIRAKTGKDPEFYRAEAEKRGLETHGELLNWLKTDCELGHGHANAIILYIRHPELAKRKLAADARNAKPAGTRPTHKGRTSGTRR
jgi:hypothetical protein